MPKRPASPPPPATTDGLNELRRGEAASVTPTQYVTLDSSEEELFTLQALHSDNNNNNNAKMSLLAFIPA